MTQPLGFSVPTEGSITPHRVRVLNKTAGASVAGYGVKFIITTPFGVGLYSRVGLDNIVSLVGVVEEAGVADGNYMAIQLAKSGHILNVNFSAAAVAGQYCVADPVNAGRFISSATFVPGQTLGIIMVAIGGAGVTTVMVMNLDPFVTDNYGMTIRPKGNLAIPLFDFAPQVVNTGGNVLEIRRVLGGNAIIQIPAAADYIQFLQVYLTSGLFSAYINMNDNAVTLIHATNSQAGTTQGYLLVPDPVADYSIIHATAGASHRSIVGTANGTYGAGVCGFYPLIQGLPVRVYIDNVAGCSKGDYITVSGVNAGQATAIVAEPAEYLGRAWNSRANPGVIYMIVNRRVV